MDTLLTALVSLWCSVAVGVIGGGALWLLRRSSLITMMVVLPVSAVLAVAASVAATAGLGLLPERAMASVLLTCIPAGLVSLGLCVVLGGRVLGGSRRLAMAARGMRREGGFPASEEAEAAGMEGAAELEGLSRELAATSAALTAARDRQHKREASRGQLITWVSHDLRTPLAGLRAMAESLRDGVVADPDRYYRTILAETRRLDHLVGDLLALSRIEAGSWTPSRSTVALEELVGDAVSAAEPLARRHGVRLRRHDVDAGTITVDVGKLARVLDNLLTNAIRRTPEGELVSISAHVGDNAVALEVSDACGGIPEVDLGKVFDAGWRRSRSSVDSAGTGLGLAVVHSIVRAHGGGVTVRNIAGGCRFTVTLPSR